MQISEVLRGAHVVLIPATEEHAEEVVLAVERFPDVPKRFAFFAKGSPTVEEERAYFRRMRESATDMLFVIRTDDGEFIGTCGLHDIDVRNDIARMGVILFNKDVQGRGYGKDALTTLLDWAFSDFRYMADGDERVGLYKVYLETGSTNEQGMHLYLSLGFQFEGRLRSQYRYMENVEVKRRDFFILGLLKNEWETRKETA